MKLLQNSVDPKVHYPKGQRLHLAYSSHLGHKIYGQIQKPLSVTTTTLIHTQKCRTANFHLELTLFASVITGYKFEKLYFLFPQKWTLENSLDRKFPILLV